MIYCRLLPFRAEVEYGRPTQGVPTTHRSHSKSASQPMSTARIGSLLRRRRNRALDVFEPTEHNAGLVPVAETPAGPDPTLGTPPRPTSVVQPATSPPPPYADYAPAPSPCVFILIEMHTNQLISFLTVSMLRLNPRPVMKSFVYDVDEHLKWQETNFARYNASKVIKETRMKSFGLKQ